MKIQILNILKAFQFSRFWSTKSQQLNRFGHTIFNSVLPHHCLVCNRLSDLEKDICQRCWFALPWALSNCQQCGRALDIAHTSPIVCGECLKNSPPYDSTIAPLIYQDSIISLITKLKFYHHLPVARLSAELISEKVFSHYKPHERPDLLIPVPLHPKRLRLRGYNQALLIAKHLGKLTKIPVNQSLIRRARHTVAQSKTSAYNRRSNVMEAFTLNNPCTASHIAIIDDVMTTGATVGTISQLLKQEGAQKISIWCLARA